MAVHIINSSIDQFYQILEETCTKVDESNYVVNAEVGSGSFKRYQKAHWDLYIGHFKLKQDLRFQRFPDTSKIGNYSISFQAFSNDLNTDTWLKPEIKKASEGIVFYSAQSTLNSIWLKDIECSMVYMSFNEDWITEIENTLRFPKVIGIMLAERPNPTFHVPLTSDIRYCLRQMLYLPKDVQGDFEFPYLYTKSVDLFTQAASATMLRASQQLEKNAIHPQDLNLLEQVKIQLINMYQEPPTLSELVDATGMSKSKLQRLFQKAYGTSVYQFIKNVRLDKAMELLMQGNSVSEAGYDVGYSSIPNFSSAFKERFSLNPGEIQSR
ncbi:helix-turn-helix domain-containing protein [Saccharicrinis aurantiacus]|uniref:helix-turn-helix domain-containing protein n=1 Tax=Saccharicrinis aurantiacus TaxID=1849719 RepID=UPI00094FF8FF|nr:AraC family transcriptional regulator [Saccharicrinis aurantiacus]